MNHLETIGIVVVLATVFAAEAAASEVSTTEGSAREL